MCFVEEILFVSLLIIFDLSLTIIHLQLLQLVVLFFFLQSKSVVSLFLKSYSSTPDKKG